MSDGKVTLTLTEEEAFTVQAALGNYEHNLLNAIYILKSPHAERLKAQDERSLAIGHRLLRLRLRSNTP